MPIKPAFYDPKKSYEDNYIDGPLIFPDTTPPPKRDLDHAKTFIFLGQKISLPFGIPPGPLLNSQFMKAAFDFGFDVSTYKTVRSDSFPCHPYPNVLFVQADQELHPDITPRLVASTKVPVDETVINITNSFGVPSQPASVWQKDVQQALSYVHEGQLMILSFMGTVKPELSQEEFIADFALAAKLAAQTGAKILEANLSCPNIGNEGLVCYNADVTEEVCKAIRKEIGNIPLIIKIGYFMDDQELEKIASIANTYAQGIAAINTLQVEVVDEKGQQALPGKMRLRSGVCGDSIRWAGLDMIERLAALKKKHDYNFSLIGVGGVMTPEHYFQYRKAGADLVQSATGAMWNPYLAHDVWKAENNL